MEKVFAILSHHWMVVNFIIIILAIMTANLMKMNPIFSWIAMGFYGLIIGVRWQNEMSKNFKKLTTFYGK